MQHYGMVLSLPTNALKWCPMMYFTFTMWNILYFHICKLAAINRPSCGSYSGYLKLPDVFVMLVNMTVYYEIDGFEC